MAPVYGVIMRTTSERLCGPINPKREELFAYPLFNIFAILFFIFFITYSPFSTNFAPENNKTKKHVNH